MSVAMHTSNYYEGTYSCNFICVENRQAHAESLDAAACFIILILPV